MYNNFSVFHDCAFCRVEVLRLANYDAQKHLRVNTFKNFIKRFRLLHFSCILYYLVCKVFECAFGQMDEKKGGWGC